MKVKRPVDCGTMVPEGFDSHQVEETTNKLTLNGGIDMMDFMTGGEQRVRLEHIEKIQVVVTVKTVWTRRNK